MRRVLLIGICVIAAGLLARADHHPFHIEEKVDKAKGRLETLFIWRVADKLSLTPNEEMEFSKVYKDIAQDRLKYSQKLEKLLDTMETAKADKELDHLIGEYKTVLKSYNDCQTRELESLKKIFSAKRLTQYMLVKRDMTRRYKDVLSSGSMQAAVHEHLKEPEVFQEK